MRSWANDADDDNDTDDNDDSPYGGVCLDSFFK